MNIFALTYIILILYTLSIIWAYSETKMYRIKYPFIDQKPNFFDWIIYLFPIINTLWGFTLYLGRLIYKD